MKNYFSDDDERLKWKEGKITKLLSTVVLDVTSRHNTSKNGIEGDYIIMNARDWVTVIAEKDDNFLMVKQWRHGENKLSIEFPGGIIDDGELPEIAGARELEEETGFKAGKLTHLGSYNPNPALFSNHMHVYLAENLTPIGKQKLDDDEFINCIEIPKQEVLEGMGTEQFPHALMASALCLYISYRKAHTLF